MSLLLLGANQFNVKQELFSNNEQGLWLDPFLSESARTWRRNLLTYSEQFDNSAWSKNNGTITANSTASPFGETTADTITQSGGTVLAFVERSVTLINPINQTYTLSVYAKKNTLRDYLLIEERWSGASQRTYFDIASGTVLGAAGTHTAQIQNIGSGWYRCSVTFTVTTGATTSIFIGPSGAGTITVPADGGSMFLFGAQLELGSTPTAYQTITDFSTEFKAAFPTHTLYQDSQGVTPCTAAGDPVGLILDQSRGGLANLGPEIVTNGGLSNATGWTVSGASPPSITGGQAVWSNSTGEIGWISPLTVGKWYLCEYDLVSYTSGSISLRDGTTNHGPVATSGFVAGRKQFFFLATFTQIRFISFASATVTIDNISIREVPGNHAFQTSSSPRPTLARIPSSGRRNLLTRTEEFDNAAWTTGGSSISPNVSATTDPLGTNTAEKLIENSALIRHEIYRSITATATSYTVSVYAKAAERTRVNVGFALSGSSVGSYFDLSNGTVVSSDAGATGAITAIGNGWYRCSTTVTATAATYFYYVRLVNSGTTVLYTGDGASGAYIWGAQLETGSTATNYQKVVATTDVTESGFGDLWHLSFDGSDDSLVNSVDFTGTDEMTVIAGVRKLSDSTQIIAELGTSFTLNTASFYLVAGADPSNGYTSASRGTQVSASTQIAASLVNQPDSSVLATTHDISSDLTTLRRNAVAATDATGEKGAGNFGNYQLFIGRRNQATLPFNGHIYQLIIRGRTTSGSKLLEAERFVGRKTGVSF